METDLPGIAKQLRALDKSELKNWLRRGELLTAARGLIADETSFRTWLRKNGQAKTTAYKAMAAWRHFGTCPEPGRFTKEAMTILAQSDAARAEAIDLSERSKVTTKVARSLVAKHTSTAPTPPPFRKPLAETSTPEEVFMVEGGIITIRPIGNATPSDMLGMLVQVQRQLRDRMLKAA